jgi:hypothetical protein
VREREKERERIREIEKEKRKGECVEKLHIFINYMFSPKKNFFQNIKMLKFFIFGVVVIVSLLIVLNYEKLLDVLLR